MYRLAHISLLVLLTAITGFGVWGACGLTKHAIIALDKWGDAAPATVANESSITQAAGSLTQTLSKATETLGQATKTLASVQTTVNTANIAVASLTRPCVPGPCGLLPDVNKTLNTVRGTFGQIEIAANHEDKNLTALDGQERVLFTDVHNTMVAGTGTFNAVSSRLNDPNLANLQEYFAQIAKSGVGIMADGKTVADYGTKQLTTPRTFLQKLETRAGDGADILAWIARHYQ